MTRILGSEESSQTPEAWGELFAPDDFLFQFDGYVLVHAWSSEVRAPGRCLGRACVIRTLLVAGGGARPF